MWLICNAHLDTVWLWRREEGAAEAHEELLYRWIEEYEPELFSEIQELAKCGKWHIMGGWELQPDCNMPSGESFVRQILSGRKYFAEKFGAGYDGSTVTARRMNDGYNSTLGHATDRINRALELFDKNRENDCCLWGVGNHGGGPSEKDLNDIAALKEELKTKGIELIHGTPGDYFFALQTDTVKPEWYEGDLNSWSPGCYKSQISIKQKHRLLENELYSAENRMEDIFASKTAVCRRL